MKYKITKTEEEYWEKQLQKHGLGMRQLGLQDNGEDDPAEIEPTRGRRVSGLNKDFEQLRTKFDSQDGFVSSGHQIKKIRTREKEIPLWATNDKETQQKVLLRAFPKLLTDSVQRKRAGRWAAVLVLFYRMNMTKSRIASELKISPASVNSILQRARRVAKGISANNSGPHGRPIGRPKKQGKKS
jgi:hypothetical protein